MSSYLTSINYVLWVLFVIIEVVLFLRLTAPWLKPVKYFMLYAVVRDLLLLTLTPKTLLYQYFVVYWLGQMVSLIWFAYISGCIIKKLLPSTPKLVYILPTIVVTGLCLLNLPLNLTARLLIMQTHCSLISAGSIATAVFINLNRQYSNIILSVLGLIGTGLFTAWAWVYLGYQPLLWEVIWIVALIGVGVAANSSQQQQLLTVPLRPSSAVQQ